MPPRKPASTSLPNTPTDELCRGTTFFFSVPWHHLMHRRIHAACMYASVHAARMLRACCVRVWLDACCVDVWLATWCIHICSCASMPMPTPSVCVDMCIDLHTGRHWRCATYPFSRRCYFSTSRPLAMPPHMSSAMSDDRCYFEPAPGRDYASCRRCRSRA